MQVQDSLCFQGVREWDSEFLALFPHRFDYIYAHHPEFQVSPVWQTESRHPLSDRLIQQAACLYGVRFGAETQYCLLDIDIGSRYHPNQDPLAIARLLAALEPLGLVSYLACTSSYSSGLHLYFPFKYPQKTWQLAIALQTLLENAGFKPTLGQLELFPNPKLYSSDGTPSLYAAHRLPLQTGSYLLNRSWEPIYTCQTTFVQQWRSAQHHNNIDVQSLQQTLKIAHRQRYHLSGKADKFLNDLNAEIEPGWTGRGQTNYLLGRIALRSYIFGHLFYASQPLEGKALVDDIVQIAKSLPGYHDWCQHQHEITRRAEEWALCVENSRYFHFGQGKQSLVGSADHLITEQLATTEVVPWNQQQRERARERIRSAIADLLNQSQLPSNTTARFKALTEYGIGGSTLYRHRDLWHPDHLGENPPHPPTSLDVSSEDCYGTASSLNSSTSLLASNDRNLPPGEPSRDFQPSEDSAVGRNSNLSQLMPETPLLDASLEQPSLQGVRYIQQVLLEVKERLRSQQKPQSESQSMSGSVPYSKADQTVHRRKMEQYLASGDPILMAEARRSLPATQERLHRQLSPFRQPEQQAIADNSTDNFVDSSTDDFADWSEVLAQISVHRRRLGWAAAQVQTALQQLFGKASQALLTDAELVAWLHWLQQRPLSFSD
ncbi:bacteriocin immunity protein [Trichocoleus desertorum AS-A10]|uniref:hypothetical protein n=1 Tax=Trichocoleus desertorum TaxID=1481672 RepID=UPI003297FE82